MEKNKFTSWICIGIILLMALSSCSALPGQVEPTPQPEPVEDFNPVVSATGIVVPIRWARLSLPRSGIIAELPVKEDQAVIAGQPLIQLRGKEQLEAAIAAAQFELASARYALDRLYEDPELNVASSNQAIIDAKARHPGCRTAGEKFGHALLNRQHRTGISNSNPGERQVG